MVHIDGPWHRKYLRGQLAWFLSWLVLTGLCVLIRPSGHGHGTHQQLGLPPCTSVLLFNRKCSGCGLTTSWSHTVRGQFAEAFAANWFGSFLYVMFTVSALIGIWAYAKGMRAYWGGKAYNRVMTTIIAAFLLYGLIRFFGEQVAAYPEPVVWSRLRS